MRTGHPRPGGGDDDGGASSVATFRTAATTATALGRRSRQRTAGELAAEHTVRAARRELGRSVLEPRAAYDASMPAARLVEDLVANATALVTLSDYGGAGAFADREALQLAAGLRNNASVVAVTMRALCVTELGLVPVLESLRRHRAVRCLDLSDTPLTPKALRALLGAVRRNTNIVAVALGGTGVDDDDAALVEDAVRHNQLRLADPTVNPYGNALVTLGTNGGGGGAPGGGWGGGGGEEEDEEEVRAAAERFQREAGLLGRPVCAHYARGRCSYGSRCRHRHPDRRGPGGELRVTADAATGAATLSAVADPDPEPVVDRRGPGLGDEFAFPAAAALRRLRRAEGRRRRPARRSTAALLLLAAAAAAAAGAVAVALCGCLFLRRSNRITPHYSPQR